METDLLANLIAKKHDVLIGLRDLSRRQSSILGEGDMSRLLSVLATKQQQLDELQQLEKQIDPFRDQDPDQRIWRSTADRDRCRQVAERCESLLREIMLMEKQCESDLIIRRDETAELLQGTHTATEARTAYSQPNYPTIGQLDVTSET